MVLAPPVHRALDTMIDTDDYYLIPQRGRLRGFFQSRTAFREIRARHDRQARFGKGAA
jgi:hypothetical protein